MELDFKPHCIIWRVEKWRKNGGVGSSRIILQVQLECEGGRRWMKGEVELGADREVKKLSQNMLVVTPKAAIVNDDATTNIL